MEIVSSAPVIDGHQTLSSDLIDFADGEVCFLYRSQVPGSKSRSRNIVSKIIGLQESARTLKP